MRNGAYSIYDQGMYDILQEKFKLDTEPSLDTVLDLTEVERLQIKGTKKDSLIYSCPFSGLTSCTYYLVEVVEDESDAEDQIELIKTAGAAHVVTAHI